MKTRMSARRWVSALTVAAGLAAAVAVAVTAQTGGDDRPFPDVPSGHTRITDIRAVADRGWFGGYTDGSFQPDRIITARQITAVVGRAFPDGMTRAEMASFLVGGDDRVMNSRRNLGLTEAAEHPMDGFSLDDWGDGEWPDYEWPAYVDEALGWATDDCRWAFYISDNNRNCYGRTPRRGHLVPPAEAWRSGGWQWDADQRRTFYYDTENLFVLSEWEFQQRLHLDIDDLNLNINSCEFVRRWVEIKRRYELTADIYELDTIAQVMTNCGIPTAGASYQPPPEEDAPELFHGFRALACDQWIAGMLRQARTEGRNITEAEALERLRRMTADAAELEFDWGRRDLNRNGEPCERELDPDPPSGLSDIARRRARLR